jgi:hypothetical protein
VTLRPEPSCVLWSRLLLLLRLVSLAAHVAVGDDEKPFSISIVDGETKRGVPLVELTSTSNVRYYSDSNGMIAIREPSLLGEEVFFRVKSHGYTFPKDGFGSVGRALTIMPGVTQKLEVQRVNIAERLYRVTGEGIYRDSVLAGVPIPIEEPLLNARVTGCDSVQTAVFRGEIYWFWGDTNRLRYPLGNFHTTGARSSLSDDPSKGVNLRYFENDDGFVSPMAKFSGDGLTWMSGLMVLHGKEPPSERMFAHYARIKADSVEWFKTIEVGLAEWNGEKEKFEQVSAFPNLAPFPHGAHTFLGKTDGVEYVYFCDPFPMVRVRANSASLADQSTYETLTCLAAGTGERPESTKVERDENGLPVWQWKRGTVGHPRSLHAKWEREESIPTGGDIRELCDFSTGKAIEAHRGSISWNAFRRRWIIVFGQALALGEIWYADAPTPWGPWGYTTKIVTHERYSFYNPRHHPMFDQDHGRTIFFEGTYTNTFSGNPDKTPRYDYNQIMYQLDLANPRLFLPVPVFESNNGLSLSEVPGRQAAFFAFPPDRSPDGLIGVSLSPNGALSLDGKTAPLFFALPSGRSGPTESVVPLYEVREDGGAVRYSLEFEKGGRPVCRVWRSPVRVALEAAN